MEYGVLLVSFGFAFYVVALLAMWKIIEERFIPEKGKVWFQLIMTIFSLIIGFWLIWGGFKLMENPG